MSGFGRGGNIFDGGIDILDYLLDDFSDRLDLLSDKIDVLLTVDVETEGKKRGYEKASKEYDVAYKAIEKQFKDTEAFFETQKSIYGGQAMMFVNRLEKLEKQKEYLENQVKSKTNDVSIKFHVPNEIVNNFMATGSLCTGTNSLVNYLDMIYYLDMKYLHKKIKLCQAEQKGYEEARILFDKKLQKLKDELKKLKKRGDSEINTLLNNILNILDDIAKLEAEIADLNILL